MVNQSTFTQHVITHLALPTPTLVGQKEARKGSLPGNLLELCRSRCLPPKVEDVNPCPFHELDGRHHQRRSDAVEATIIGGSEHPRGIRRFSLQGVVRCALHDIFTTTALPSVATMECVMVVDVHCGHAWCLAHRGCSLPPACARRTALPCSSAP